MICKICGSQDFKHEEKKGRGLPPKGYVKQGSKRISWLGIWDVYTCSCGDEIRILRK